MPRPPRAVSGYRAPTRQPFAGVAWLKNNDTHLDDELLHILAWPASTDGGRDPDAALARAWLLDRGGEVDHPCCLWGRKVSAVLSRFTPTIGSGQCQSIHVKGVDAKDAWPASIGRQLAGDDRAPERLHTHP